MNSNMSPVQERIWNTLITLDGEEVLQYVTDYLGLQILDEDFEDFLIKEGIMDEEEYDEDFDEAYDFNFDDEDFEDDPAPRFEKMRSRSRRFDD